MTEPPFLCRKLVVLFILCCPGIVVSLSLSAVKTIDNNYDRRRILTTALSWVSIGGTILTTESAAGVELPFTILGASAAASTTAPVVPVLSSYSDIESARNTLKTLLEKWEKAVIDCTYADVPRELLETRNKELLLEKAATSALFDKSGSVVSCKTTNRIVRDYIGATGIGPLAGLEKKMRLAMDLVLENNSSDDDDVLDTYVQTMEYVEQELAKARSLSYTAGVADLSAVNNFAEAEKKLVLVSTSESNLEQTRQTIINIVRGLDKVLQLISGAPVV